MKNKVGYTTGVFDLFHVGHLEILRKSKEYCDYLIVGVSSDELVKKYKNKTPIIPLDQRMKIVSAIKYVDEVVVQNDRNKLAAYEKLKFNIMFVGDDWKGTSFFNALEKRFLSHNVLIHYFPYTKDISSSGLRKYIQFNDKK